EGDRKKLSILNKALELYRAASNSSLKIGGVEVVATSMYRTGKYDRIYPPYENFVFPDEGVRFFFSTDRLNHLTVRPSGTGNSLRFHVQHHSEVNESNLIPLKKELRARAAGI